ncbi:hypothetical protein [Corynebacterium variabile]|uniref:hypothetical protein n=1 Tax=Corynebacterium variabile TaxID=1727 RepID=UPI0028B0C4FB|nr:hypothetical protein [Corynebacterium variabile]
MFDITDESYLAKRAVDELESVVSYTYRGDREFQLTRSEGLDLTYRFTDGRNSDAWIIQVELGNLAEALESGENAASQRIWVLSPEEIESKLYDDIIVPWSRDGKLP